MHEMEDDSKILKAENNSDEERRKDNASYWKCMMKSYEKRNASLERRRTALVERVHFMECALPSLLMSAAVVGTTNRSSDQPAKVSCHDGGTFDCPAKRKSRKEIRYRNDKGTNEVPHIFPAQL